MKSQSLEGKVCENLRNNVTRLFQRKLVYAVNMRSRFKRMLKYI
jgi:hypothetical protein